MTRDRFVMVVVVLGVSLAIRLTSYHQLRDNPLYQFLTLDERGNHEFAVAILHGKMPPVSYYKAPLYHYFLAGLYAVLGEDSLRARLAQCILVSVCPVLTALIARRLFGGMVGWIAGLWAAVFWTFVHYSTELLDTAVASLLYLLLAYGLVSWDNRRWTKWFACGVILGLGAITRPNILPFAPVLALVVLIVSLRPRLTPPDSTDPPGCATASQARPWFAAAFNVLALAIGCCCAVLPVTLRNRIVGGEWVLIGAYGGLNVHVANNPYSDSKNGPLLVDETRFLSNTTWDANEPWARCCLNYKNAYRLTEAELGRRPTPGEFSSLLSKQGMQYIRENPGWFAQHALQRFCWLFNAYEFPSNKDHYHFAQHSSLLNALSWFHYGWIAPLALVGMGLALSRSTLRTPALYYLLVMWASLALPALMFIINARFRAPMVQLMVPFAAYGVVELIRLAWTRSSPRRLALGVAALAGLAIFSNLNLFGYRQDHQPYLRFAYAVACLVSGQTDRLDAAVARFEKDLKIDLEQARRTGQRSNTTLLVDHCCPMRLLLPYHVQKGNKDKALAAANWMLDHEIIDGPWAPNLFNVFLEAGQRPQAERALRIVEQQYASIQPPLVADALFRYGKTYADRPSLEKARQTYSQLSTADPSNLETHRRLEELSRVLQPITSTRGTR